GIEPPQHLLNLSRWHGRAADGWFSGSAPNVHENTGSISRDLATRIVIHQNSPAIELILPQHVFRAVSIRGDRTAIDDLVVKMRSCIVHTFDTGRQVHVRHLPTLPIPSQTVLAHHHGDGFPERLPFFPIPGSLV